MLTCGRVESKVKAAGAPYVPHLFVDQTDAPADVVAHTIDKVVQEVHAKYIILAKSNKVLLHTSPTIG